MAYLFNNQEYFEFRSRIYQTLKKSLETKIDLLVDSHRQRPHPVDPHDDVVLDGAQLNFCHQGEIIPLPPKILEVSLANILNAHNIQTFFSSEEQEELKRLVPGHSLENIHYALEGKGLSGGHLEDFEKKIRSGYFSIFREKENQINHKLDTFRLKQIYQSTLNTIRHQRETAHHKERIVVEDQCSSVDSINELSYVEELSENSQATETEEQMGITVEEQLENKVFFHYDASKIKGQQELIAMGQQKTDRKAMPPKVTQPYRPRNSEWMQNYRRQELMRYSNPTKPWIYQCEDGRKVTVAPVAKKVSVLTGKPREHPMLKTERPACVTILTLVRDAAARLVNGVGTRADISQLLKESQYVNQDLPEDKLSNIVSGALDRLHYMADACVKYDSEKKLWLYLHFDRNHEHPAWGEDGDEYLQKNSKKRKYNYTDQ